MTASRGTGRSRWRLLILLVAVALFASATTVASAAPQPIGRIRGSVTGFDGAKLAGVRVEAWSITGLPGEPAYSENMVASVESRRNGAYELAGLPSGQYRLRFIPPDLTRYTFEVYNDQTIPPLGAAVEVTAGRITRGVDVVLGPAGSISGTVVDDDTGLPLAGMCLMPCIQPGAQLYGVYTEQIVTGADGSFTLPGLPPDYYYGAAWDPGGMHEWTWFGEFDLASGEAVGDVVVRLRGAGCIAGSVQDEAASPLGGIHIDGMQFVEDEGGGWWEYVGWAESQPDGTYVMTGLPEGDFCMLFTDFSGQYAQQYYRGAIVPELGQMLGVVKGATTAAETVTMADQPGFIAGTVTEPGGAPIEGVYVGVWLRVVDQFYQVTGTFTDAEGHYSTHGLTPGEDYRVAFEPGEQYEWETWDGHNDAWVDGADPVVVTAGGTTVCDAELRRLPSVSGTVTTASGAPATGESVVGFVRRSDEWGEWWEWVCETWVGEDGTYRLYAQPADYLVGFAFNSVNYAMQFYDGANTLGEATPLTLAEGQDIGGIDAVLQPGATIAGVVTAPGGAPLEGIYVNAFMYNEGGFVCSGSMTDAQGAYLLRGLAPADYAIEFWDESGTYLGELYDNLGPNEEPTPVTVSEFGQAVVGIDAELSAASHINGTVTGGGGPLVDIGVEAQIWAEDEWGGWWETVQWAGTDYDGFYDLSLRAGSYAVRFVDWNGVFASQFYPGVPVSEVPAFVTVAEGETASGIDVELPVGATISGYVTGPSGQPAAGVSVSAVIVRDGNPDGVAWADTNTEGYYRLTGLAVGSYAIHFWDSNGMYVEEIYHDTRNWEEATYIAISAPGEERTGVDESLALASHITGSVSGGGLGLPSAGIEAQVWVDDGGGGGWWESVGWSGTNMYGDYDLPLSEGTYAVYFADWDGSFVSERYNDKRLWEPPDTVTVGPGETIGGIDADLAPGAHMTGIVTNEEDVGIEGVWVQMWLHVGEDMVPLDGTTTGPDGAFDMGGLPEGTYHVAFEDWSGTYLSETYSDKMGWPDGDDVIVTIGGTTPASVDAVLSRGSVISGTIRDAVTGDPIPFADVQIDRWDPVNENWPGFCGWEADEFGSYREVVPAGTYRVTAGHRTPGYAARTHTGLHPWEAMTDADGITVATGEQAEGVDVVLPHGWGIGGSVTVPGGAPAVGAWAGIFTVEGGIPWCVGSAMVGEDGTFQMWGLDYGTYIVGYQQYMGSPWLEFFDNVTEWPSATPVTVGEGFQSPEAPAAELTF